MTKETITYKRLMQRVDDGTAEIHAWTNDGSEPMVDVTLFGKGDKSNRYHLRVTGKPVEGSN